MTTPERSIEEIVEEFISENMNKTFIREKGRPKEDGYIIESYSIPFKTALEQTLKTERQKRKEVVEAERKRMALIVRSIDFEVRQTDTRVEAAIWQSIKNLKEAVLQTLTPTDVTDKT